MNTFSGRSEARYLPNTGPTICRRHSPSHRNGERPVSQHQCNASISERAQVGSELNKNQHHSNWQGNHRVQGRGIQKDMMWKM